MPGPYGQATDLAAKRQKVNRSALIREALRQHLKRLRDLELEAQDRRGYLAQPQREEEFRMWEDAAAWPIRAHAARQSCQRGVRH